MIDNIDVLLNDPRTVAAITLAIIIAYHYIKRMPYSEFVVVTQVKHRVFLLLAPLARRRNLRIIEEQSRRPEDEYITTVDQTPKELAKQFKVNNINQHLIAGSKRRDTPAGKQWAHTQWSYQHDSGKQTEIWLYTNPDGTTDIYAHHEASVFNPEGHLKTPFTPGDPEDVLGSVLSES